MRYRLANASDKECAEVEGANSEFVVVRDGQSLVCRLLTAGPPARYLVRDEQAGVTQLGRVITVHPAQSACHVEGHDIGWVREQSMRGVAAGATESERSGDIRAPMPGRILRVGVNVGDAVTKGTPLLAMEAMKMENELFSPSSGTVNTLHVKAGDVVDTGQVLVLLSADADASNVN